MGAQINNDLDLFSKKLIETIKILDEVNTDAKKKSNKQSNNSNSPNAPAQDDTKKEEPKYKDAKNAIEKKNSKEERRSELKTDLQQNREDRKELRDAGGKNTDEYKAKKEEYKADKEEKDAIDRDYYAGFVDKAKKCATEVNALNKAAQDITKADTLAKTKELEEETENEKKILADKYKQGLISKKEFDRETAALDKKLTKDKAKLAREQAEKDKAFSIVKVIIDTAVAVMSAWTAGPIMGAILTPIILAAGAAQIVAIEKTPLPKARKGGMIVGGSHEQGGVLIEAEGGEAILSRAAMSAFPGVANLMNAAALSGGINDGGYAARSMASGSVEFGNRGGAAASQGIDYERLSSMMSEKMSQTKLFVAVTDINDGQRNYARISDMAKL